MEATPSPELPDIFDVLCWTDTEKEARIEKLRRSLPVEITGEEIPHSEDLKEYRKNAKEYGRNLRKYSPFVNRDKGEAIHLTAGAFSELQQHDFKDVEHLQSYAAIPQIIENAIFIDERPNEDVQKHRNVSGYQYYAVGLTIGGVAYTVKAVVAVERGKRYYDHKLTKIEKGRLLDIISAIPTAGEAKRSPLSEYKDKRLFSILQTKTAKKIGGVALTPAQQQALASGEAVRMEGLVNRTTGQLHTAYVRRSPEDGRLRFYQERPEQLKSAARVPPPKPANRRGRGL
jgi:hypothetical protein